MKRYANAEGRIMATIAKARSPHSMAVEQALLNTAETVSRLGRADLAEFLQVLAQGGAALTVQVRPGDPFEDDDIVVDIEGMPSGMDVVVATPNTKRLHRAYHGYDTPVVIDKVCLR